MDRTSYGDFSFFGPEQNKSTARQTGVIMLLVLRWLSLIPIVVYWTGGIILGFAGLLSTGWRGASEIPSGAIWASTFGRNSFDLFAVFFERKLTLVIADYPVGGDQLWWGWLRPAFEQPPSAWLGYGALWAVLWAILTLSISRWRKRAA